MANKKDNSQTDYSVKQPKKKKLDLGLSGLSTREKMEAIAGQMSALADELTTERELKHGGREDDPAAKPFTKLPEPAYIASGAILTGGLTAAAHKLKESHNKLLRVIGNVAQDVQIGVNAGNAVRNSQEPINSPSTAAPKPSPNPKQHAENLPTRSAPGYFSPSLTRAPAQSYVDKIMARRPQNV